MTSRRLFLVLALGALVTWPTLAAEQTLAQGSWTTKGYDIAGQWKIVQEEGKLFVVLDPAFRTKKAPDLKIFLSPKPLAQLNNRNATQDSLRVGPLQKSRGAQRLEIPSGTSLDEYKTVLIHCEKFSKLWGGAALR